MAARQGIVVSNTVVTSDTRDPFVVVESGDIRGGIHKADTKNGMFAIPDFRRQVGMMCYVEDEEKTYQLVGGITDDKWRGLADGVVWMHEQRTPSATWTIDHNLGRYPEAEVQIGDVWSEPTVDHDGKTRTTLSFAYPVSGIAQLK